MALDLNALKNYNNQIKEDKKAEYKDSGDRIKWYSFPHNTEKVKVRVLEEPGRNLIGKIVYQHRNIRTPDEKKNYAFCMSTYNKICPICETLKDYETRFNAAMLGDKFSEMTRQGKGKLNMVVIEDSRSDISKGVPVVTTLSMSPIILAQ